MDSDFEYRIDEPFQDPSEAFKAKDSHSWPRTHGDLRPTVHDGVKELPAGVVEEFNNIVKYAERKSRDNSGLLRSKLYHRLLNQEIEAQNLVLAYFEKLRGNRMGESEYLLHV